MMNKNERMEKLNKAGINTNKYFNFDLPNGLKPGATIQLIINDNGEPMIVTDNYDTNVVDNNDYIANQIIEDGYVRNTKLHRRFVMAQMFHMLNYVSYDGRYSGYNDCLKRMYGYNYTIDMMIEESRILSKLEARDQESFDERSHFFTQRVIVNVIDDYLNKLMKYIDNLPNHKCKGIPYKKIKGMNIFNTDLDKKIYMPIRNYIHKIKYARNYAEIYRTLNAFGRNMIKLPYNTPKSKVWIDAFKGEGAFYTLKNLVMFHGCRIEVTNRYDIGYGTSGIEYLNAALEAYKGEGWRMFALMKKVIADNNFDFYARMSEIYNR